MKKWLKKQKYKIAIALCSILSIFTLFLGINKTYAYETDAFSYTISNINETTIYNGNTYYYNETDKYVYNTTSNTQLNFTCNFDTTYNFTSTSYYYLLINCNLQFNNSSYSGNFYNTYGETPYLNVYFSNFSVSSTGNNISRFSQNEYNSYGFSTLIFKLGVTSSVNNVNDMVIRLSNLSTRYYRFYIYNIDFVSSSDIGLSQYYDTYYGQIEDNYNTLLDNYNDLQEDYDTLETNYNNLETNYNNLTTEYNNLSNNINSFANSGVLQYIQTIDFELTSYDRQNYWEKEFTLLEFMQTNYFTNTNFIDIDLLFNDWIHEVNTSDSALLYVTINFIPIDIDFFNLVTTNIANISYRSISLNNNLTITLNNVDRITKSSIESSYGSNLDNTQVINVYVEYDSLNSDVNTDNSIFTDLSISQVSYNRGFQMGKQQSESLILELNNRIATNEQTISQLQYELQFSTTTNTELVSQIDSLETENTRFRYVIASLEAQLRSYQESSNDYNLNRMIWTIASTPFESFKQIWNVDFFGVNISTMITGFITGIIVLWVIKKFFL